MILLRRIISTALCPNQQCGLLAPLTNNLVQNAEIRPLHFTGNLPTETVLTPSPATALLMISGMAGLAAFARRKG